MKNFEYIFIQNIQKNIKLQLTTHFYSRVISPAKWRALFLGYSKQEIQK